MCCGGRNEASEDVVIEHFRYVGHEVKFRNVIVRNVLFLEDSSFVITSYFTLRHEVKDV